MKAEVIVAERIASTRARAARHYAAREVSRGYWALQYARAMESRTGYVRVVIGGDLRRRVEPGTIVIRQATGGKWGRSRKEKAGRPMTAREIVAWDRERRAALAAR